MLFVGAVAIKANRVIAGPRSELFIKMKRRDVIKKNHKTKI